MSTGGKYDSNRVPYESAGWWRAETNRLERSSQVRIELKSVLSKLSAIDESRQREIDEAMMLNEKDEQILERIRKTSGQRKQLSLKLNTLLNEFADLES